MERPKQITIKRLKEILEPYPDDAKIGQYAMGGWLNIELSLDNGYSGVHFSIDLNDGSTYPVAYEKEETTNG